MGKVATSTFFYRRGVPNEFYLFGAICQNNFPVIQPSTNDYYFSNLIHYKWNKKIR